MTTEVPAGFAAPETPVAAPQATPELTSTAEQAQETEQPEAPEKLLTQSEVNKLIAKEKAQAERRAMRIARAEAERDHYKQMVESQQRPAQQAQQPGAPKADDPKYASNYEKYLIDLAKWELKQEQEAEARQREERSRSQQQESSKAELGKTLRQKIEDAAEKYPDIEDVARGDVPYTEPMLHYFADSEMAGDLIYHLGKNPKDAARIAELSPAGQFRELAKLETKLSAPPKPTSAPAPIKPTGGNASGEKDPDKMTTEEWREWRERDLRSKNRR